MFVPMEGHRVMPLNGEYRFRHPDSRPDAGNTYLTDRDQQVGCAIQLEPHTGWDYRSGAVLGDYGGAGRLFFLLGGVAGGKGGFDLSSPPAEKRPPPRGTRDRVFCRTGAGAW